MPFGYGYGFGYPGYGYGYGFGYPYYRSTLDFLALTAFFLLV
ncbi:MAG TPA: hypothetical protein PLL98_01900 [Bacillota bacterium]|nr:hypothetical protein [Bacillota bacterium]HOR85217.1 hypothetical protein [Bacillota bacterium]HPL53410.1 hypothetical protein [Bacillota bacterium]